MKNGPENSEKNADSQKIKQGCENGEFHFPDVSGSQILGDDDGASDPAADGNGNEYICDCVGCAYGRQCVFSHIFSHHRGVHQVVELLKQVADHHGNREQEQGFSGRTGEHSCLSHKVTSFLGSSLSTLYKKKRQKKTGK